MKQHNCSLFRRLTAAVVGTATLLSLTACSIDLPKPTLPPHLIINDPNPTHAADYITPATEETLPIQPTETTAPTIEIDLNNLVTDAYSDALFDANGCACCYHIPQFNLPGNSAKQLNEKIYKQCYDILLEDVYSFIGNDGWSPFFLEMSYLAGHKGNYASVIVGCSSDVSYWEYYIYTVSAATGREATMDELLAEFGMDREAYYDLVEKRLNQYWDEWIAEAESNNPSIADDTFVKECISRTLTDANIQKTIPYINPNGGLSFIAEIYSMAGADSYDHLINANGNLESDYPQCTIRHTYRNPVSTDDPLEYFVENCDRMYFS